MNERQTALIAAIKIVRNSEKWLHHVEDVDYGQVQVQVKERHITNIPWLSIRLKQIDYADDARHITYDDTRSLLIDPAFFAAKRPDDLALIATAVELVYAKMIRDEG